jgi:hypothetical protein
MRDPIMYRNAALIRARKLVPLQPQFEIAAFGNAGTLHTEFGPTKRWLRVQG